MPGPAPKHPSERRRRNATVPMTQLPAEGRKGRTPAWPLPPELRTKAGLDAAEAQREILEAQIDSGTAEKTAHAKLSRLDERIAILNARLKQSTAMEKALWKDLWALPQAVMWERMKWTREVAQYVRWKCLAELGDLDAGKEARQLSDRLGLNPVAMLKLRWEVVTDEVAEKRRDQGNGKASVRRLRPVADVGAEG